MTIHLSDPEDIFVWADGSWCFRSEYEDASNGKSDDFYVLHVDTPAHAEFLIDQEY